MEEIMKSQTLNRTLAGFAAVALMGAFAAPGTVSAQGAYWLPADGSPDDVKVEYRLRDHGCDNVRGEWRVVNESEDYVDVTVTKTAYTCPGELDDDVRTTVRRFGTIAPGDMRERTRDDSVCGGAWARSVEVLEYDIEKVDPPEES
ncbi:MULTISPECIES: hypothetical protein [unclassified Thioalkalivibrio]|uniref:hypothetical protein n=1 Tax=unclassified Thioalkalivibrio TaxID=2621013 RepID=UPI00039E8BF7|nr:MULTISPECIES: hypothetical protein [unclassified Thioalkalivibrio]